MSEEKTIFHEAFLRKNQSMVDSIMSIAEQSGALLALNWKPSSDSAGDVLQSSLSTHSTNDVRDAVNLVCSRASPFGRAANIIKTCFRTLLSQYLDIMDKALADNLFVMEACLLNVHVDFMHPRLRRDMAVHITTSDTYLEWINTTDPDALEMNWKAQNSDAVSFMEKDGNVSTTQACLKIICIEDAAKVGMKGIIRPLLLQKAPAHIFKSDVVKWVVLYKWFKIWKSRFIRSVVRYFAFLVFFTFYAYLVGHSPEISDESQERKILTASVLAVNVGFGVLMSSEEIFQIRTFCRDGKDYLGRQKHGLYYFLRSRWNWLDMASCFLLTIFIPALHVLALLEFGYERTLSAVVAVEAILASIKVFKFCGSLRMGVF